MDLMGCRVGKQAHRYRNTYCNIINHIAPKLLKQITSLEVTSAALRVAPQKQQSF